MRRSGEWLLRRLPAALIVLSMAVVSCDRGRKVDVLSGINPSKMPTMTTKNVATFISDSGIIQYKIVTPLWLVYDERDTPYWSFPKGVYLQKFDRNYKPIATIAADSARYFSQKKLWRLDGNVELTRVPRDLFVTQQLFWNEKDHRLYSDSFIHIETATHILEGYGFTANDRLTNYRILRPSGVFPFNSEAARPGSGGPPPGMPTGEPLPSSSEPADSI